MSKSKQGSLMGSNLSQSEQQLLLRQDMKPVISTQQQQQHHHQNRLGYPGQTSMHMPQSQTHSFQFPGSTSAGSPKANQRITVNAQRQLQQHYMTRPPPEYQATVEPNNSGLSTLQPRLVSRSPLLVNVPDNMGTDQSNRNVELKNSNTSVSKSNASNSTSQASSVSSGQSFSGIPPFSGLVPMPGLEYLSETPVTKSRPFPGVIPLTLENMEKIVAARANRPFPGVRPLTVEELEDIANIKKMQSFPNSVPITLEDLEEIPTTKPSPPFPGLAPIPGLEFLYNDMMRPFAGLHTPNSTPTSVSESFGDATSTSNLRNSYSINNSASNQNSVSLANSLSNTSNTSSKKCQGGMTNSNLMPFSVSQQYSSMSSASLSTQGQSQIMSITTTAPTYSAAKSRTGGKQTTSRASKSNGPYHRQQKPPNVNVGPEGLNISQRPPVMSTDWRHAYIQQSQQQISNINAQLRSQLAYPRNVIQNCGQNINNGNNYQSPHMNPNSPANSNNPGSLSLNADHLLSGPNRIHHINSETNNMVLQQQAVNENNISVSSSQLQLPASIVPLTESMNQSRQIFSPSPSSNSSQNMVPDNNQFNLDFLDNLDCSTSSLILSFDVLEENDIISLDDYHLDSIE